MNYLGKWRLLPDFFAFQVIRHELEHRRHHVKGAVAVKRVVELVGDTFFGQQLVELLAEID